MPELTQLTVNAYLEVNGIACMFCGSENIESGRTDDENTRRVYCLDCGEVWYDCYKLVGVIYDDTEFTRE